MSDITHISVLSTDSISKDDIQMQLNSLDTVLPRCIEDIIVAVGIVEATLPQIMQDRLSQKRALREQYNSL